MTADGTWILFVSLQLPDRGVWKMRADGSQAGLLARDLTMPVPTTDPDLFAAATGAEKTGRVLRLYHVSDGTPVPWKIDLPQRFDIISGRSQWMGTGRLAYVDSDASNRFGVSVCDVSPTSAGSPRVLAGFDPLQPTESFDVTKDGRRVVLSVRNMLQTITLVEGVGIQ